ncbi:TRAP transporter large permease [Halomonas denitrificans]|uniref:TRAP transporter large permease n=1 Tax=Halomonas TaxID=2745 RepID=UPI001A8C218F|nr:MULTISPECIES: TRAP transporter large permease [Halomonas]MED5296112.1 TRAP transporter large permease [Pseudomonadota bacterium]MBN8412654.1 TRAP transporter large permease [Halomonas litopenaei]MBY5924966.1 TRAP transporter large permease [Halomonas sp. DP4Y7-2]MBY5928752.1 TRAP transporter large permease [Halomonas sp. DP8Y7-3]MBY6206227.1 TRAP transporter large permease [Halomonas sp. DP3Y7-2]
MTLGALTLVGVFALAILIDIPIAFGLILAVLSYLLMFGAAPMMVSAQQFVAGMESFTLLAIPLFVLAAQLMNHAGLTQRLVRLCMALVGDIKGGLAVVAVLACMMFGALSGSGVADVIAIGSMLLPAMQRSGYHRGFSSALVGTASSIGTVIPPSIVMIVYGTTSNTSVGKLFMGGVIPGLLLTLALVGVAIYVSRRNGWSGGTRPEPGERRRAFIAALPALLVPVLIIGGIRFGVFTPTEAAASAIVYALIVGTLIYRSLSLKDIVDSVIATAETSGAILIIIGAAGMFAWGLTYEQVPQAIAALIGDITDSRYGVLLLLTAVLLVLGSFMESIAIIIIVTPIVMPLLGQYGIDPVHFGVLLTVNLAIGANTPPLGVDLMAACRIAGISVMESLRYLGLMLGAMVAVLLLITFVPDIVLFLPNLME